MSTKLSKSCSLVAAALFYSVALADNWKFLYEREGLSVYKSADQPNNLEKYKAEAVLELNIFELMAVLTDIPRRTEWVNSLGEIKLLEGNPTIKGIVFNVFKLPWPASDREAILEATGAVDYTDLSVVISFKTVNRESIPVVKGRVRVPYASGQNSLKYIDKNNTHVSIQMQMDPGGLIPNWIANILIKNAPAETLRALRNQVVKTRGEYNEFIRIHTERARESLSTKEN